MLRMEKLARRGFDVKWKFCHMVQTGPFPGACTTGTTTTLLSCRHCIHHVWEMGMTDSSGKKGFFPLSLF